MLPNVACETRINPGRGSFVLGDYVLLDTRRTAEQAAELYLASPDRSELYRLSGEKGLRVGASVSPTFDSVVIWNFGEAHPKLVSLSATREKDLYASLNPDPELKYSNTSYVTWDRSGTKVLFDFYAVDSELPAPEITLGVGDRALVKNTTQAQSAKEDSRRIDHASNGTYLYDRTKGSFHKVSDEILVQDPSFRQGIYEKRFSPDGKYFLTYEVDNVSGLYSRNAYVVDLATGAKTQIDDESIQVNRIQTTDGDLWSASSRYLAFVDDSISSGASFGGIYVYDIRTGQRHGPLLQSDGKGLDVLRWSDKGNRLLLDGNGCYLFDADKKTFEKVHPSEQTLCGGMSPDGSYVVYGILPKYDGRPMGAGGTTSLYTRSARGRLMSLHVDSGETFELQKEKRSKESEKMSTKSGGPRSRIFNELFSDMMWNQPLQKLLLYPNHWSSVSPTKVEEMVAEFMSPRGEERSILHRGSVHENFAYPTAWTEKNGLFSFFLREQDREATTSTGRNVIHTHHYLVQPDGSPTKKITTVGEPQISTSETSFGGPLSYLSAHDQWALVRSLREDGTPTLHSYQVAEDKHYELSDFPASCSVLVVE